MTGCAMLVRVVSCLALVAGGVLPAAARAEVTRFEVLGREAGALGGRVFATGAAEKITGRATIALDPVDPHNAVIADLALAPRNAQGRVEAVSDVVILRPARPNGILLFEVLNRGRKLLTGSAQDATGMGPIRLETAEDAGNGFLLDQGFTLVWAGWQSEVPAGLMRIALPTISGVVGRSREEAQFDGTPGAKTLRLSYPAADPADARLSMRLGADAAPTTPVGLTYLFVDPSTVEITPPPGAPATALYDFSYRARDPQPSGMGLAAIRDVTAFLRRDGSAANPLAEGGQSGLHRAIGLGISQSGRVLRDFVYFGMNQDEAGRMVFEGVMPIVPGARRSFTNAPFAQPGRNPGPQFDRLYPVLQFPFTYPVLEDRVSGRRDGILLRCGLSNSCPLVIQADSEFEFWGSQASLMVTDPAGRPVEMPGGVRLYLFAGTPHGNAFDAVATKRADCAMPLNPNTWNASVRALIVTMRQWVEAGVPPPASRYPSRAEGTLVSLEEAYLPTAGLPYLRQQARAQWVDQTPEGPVVRGDYPLFVPRTGRDGNVVSGIRLPIVAAPRATYTGWNPVAGAEGSQDLCTQMGGVLPFAARAVAGDPRPSLEALYPTPESYVAAVRAAADALVAERLLLPADAAAAVRAAEAGSLAKLGSFAP